MININQNKSIPSHLQNSGSSLCHKPLWYNYLVKLFNPRNLLNSLCYAPLTTLVILNPINPVLAQEQVTPTLTVTGEGIETISATLIQVNLGVEIQGEKAIAVQQEIAKRTTAVVDFLKERRVEKLQTTGFRLQPQYRYENNQRSFVGYLGVNTVSFQLPVEKIGNLLDEAVKIGATRIDSISFTATAQELAAAEKEALRKATQDAQEQAEAVLRALNLTSQEIIKIDIKRSSSPQPRLGVQRAATNGTPIIGGEQNVRAFVTLQISYE